MDNDGLGVFDNEEAMVEEQSLSEDDRWALAEIYHIIIEGSATWRECLEPHRSLLDVDITLETTFNCSCGRFFEQHPTTIDDTEDDALDKVLEQIRSGHCRCLDDDDPFIPPIRAPLASKGLLHAAVACTHHEADVNNAILQYLLDNGCDVNKSSSTYNYTPLFRAVVSRNKKALETLLQREDIDVNLKSRQELHTPLIEAILLRLNDIITLLLQSPKIDLNACNFRKETAVIVAARMGETSSLEQLLTAGADVNLRDRHDRTALMYSVMYELKEVTKVLINHGASLHERSTNGESPLYLAVSSGNYVITQVLLEAGADVNEAAVDDYPLLLVATYSKFTNIVQLLMEHNVDIHHANRMGYQAIHIAAWNGFVGILTLLLNAGAACDCQTHDLNTPLSLAAHGNHENIVNMLLTKGCNVNNSDKDQDTPLHYATYNSNLDCTMSLLNHGADPDCVNRLGCTPLWNAVYRSNTAIVKVLLKVNVALNQASKGIDQHAQSDMVQVVFDKPRSPLWVSAHQGDKNIALMLVMCGCRVSSETWIAEGNFPGKSAEDEEFKDFLRTYYATPLPLTFQCRLTLRRLAGRDVRHFTCMLHLPDKFRSFLMMKDLLD